MRPAHRQHSINRSKVAFTKGKAGTGTKFAQMRWRACARNGDHIILLMQKPGDRQAGGTCAQIGSQITGTVQEVLVV